MPTAVLASHEEQRERGGRGGGWRTGSAPGAVPLMAFWAVPVAAPTTFPMAENMLLAVPSRFLSFSEFCR